KARALPSCLSWPGATELAPISASPMLCPGASALLPCANAGAAASPADINEAARTAMIRFMKLLLSMRSLGRGRVAVCTCSRKNALRTEVLGPSAGHFAEQSHHGVAPSFLWIDSGRELTARAAGAIGLPMRVVRSEPELVIVRLPHSEGLPLPSYETAGAAGMDL